MQNIKLLQQQEKQFDTDQRTAAHVFSCQKNNPNMSKPVPVLKGQFTPKISNVHIVTLTCSVVYPSRLFWCELLSLEISTVEMSAFSRIKWNSMVLGLWCLKRQKNTLGKLNSNRSQKRCVHLLFAVVVQSKEISFDIVWIIQWKFSVLCIFCSWVHLVDFSLFTESNGSFCTLVLYSYGYTDKNRWKKKNTVNTVKVEVKLFGHDSRVVTVWYCDRPFQ